MEVSCGRFRSPAYTPGEKPLPIRWVLVRDPAGKLKDTALLCTDLEAGPQQIVAWYDEALFRPYIDQTFSFEDAAAAHHYIQARKNTGKVLLIP